MVYPQFTFKLFRWCIHVFIKASIEQYLKGNQSNASSQTNSSCVVIDILFPKHPRSRSFLSRGNLGMNGLNTKCVGDDVLCWFIYETYSHVSRDTVNQKGTRTQLCFATVARQTLLCIVVMSIASECHVNTDRILPHSASIPAVLE